MKKKSLFLFISFVAIELTAVMPQAQAQGMNLYYESFNERTNQLVSKVWMDANGNQRVENPASPGDFMINRIDVTTRIITVYSFNGRTKTYTRITIVPDTAGAGMVETFLGQEMVEGRMCNHYRITWTGRSEVEEQWRDPTLHNLPIRQRVGSEPPTVTRNIRQGTQPAHLFEIPSDFREQSLPDLQGLFGGQQPQQNQQQQDFMNSLQDLFNQGR